MNILFSSLWVLIGILISLVLPVAIHTLFKAKTDIESGLEGLQPSIGERFRAWWAAINGKRYLQVLAAATLVAFVAVFFLDITFASPRQAAVAGFAWESLVGKLAALQKQDSPSG